MYVNPFSSHTYTGENTASLVNSNHHNSGISLKSEPSCDRCITKINTERQQQRQKWTADKSITQKCKLMTNAAHLSIFFVNTCRCMHFMNSVSAKIWSIYVSTYYHAYIHYQENIKSRTENASQNGTALGIWLFLNSLFTLKIGQGH